ncbi:DUF637 domain-containing protein [Hydrogenophaga sp.]|uniref:DUF637 domain-containing protein n=1 Tax=Hydrogenophaga sp. TaxID=1904254 RepID=UPI0035B4612C
MDAPSSTLPSLDTSPRRAGWFKRSVATLVMLSISVGSFAQVTGPILRGSYGQPVTGFAPNGTFIQNGVVVGNPHQQMHNLENPSLWTLGAAALTNTTDPSFVQGTLGQMEGVSAPLSEPGGLSMGRLYINTSPANPYTAAAPFTNPADQANQANNALIWNQAVAGTGGYQSAGGTWIARTHPDSSGAIFNSGLTGFVDKGVVNAAMDPNGGAVAVWLTQGAAVTRHLAAVQQQNANLLGSRIFFTQQNMGSLSPTQSGFNSQADATIFEQMIGSSPNLWGGGTDPSFQLGYIRDDGSAQFFNLSDKHFRGSQSQGAWSGDSGGLEFGRDDAWINAMLGQELRSAADKREKGLNAAAGIDMGYFQDSKALFMQGIDLYRHVNKGDWGLLDGLRTGAIGPGHPDYERARTLSEDAFRQAYVYHTEYDTKLKYSKEAAAYQANQLQLTGVSNADLFGKGLNLFDKRGDPEQERLLGMLQRGELSESHPRYQEIRGLAEARFKVAYQKALEPPPKPNPLKQIVAVVVAAVAIMLAQPYIATWAMSVGSAVGATSAFAVQAIGSAISASISSSISTAIVTGSVSKGLQAGLKAGAAGVLTGGLQVMMGGGLVGDVMAKTVAQTAIYGSDFGDNLLTNAINAGVEVVSKDVAQQIKRAELGALGTELAHAGLGCVAGTFRAQDGSGCAPGAVGAVTGHLVAQWFDPAGGRTLSDAEASFYSQASGIVGGVAAALAGGSNNVQGNFDIGQSAGDNAARNNHFSRSPFDSVRQIVNQENARLTKECGTSCTEADFRRIDQQVAKLEMVANLTEISKRSTLTTEQALQYGEAIAALLPLYGTPIALYQAIGGQSLSGQDLSTGERMFNMAAAALPLGSAAYKLVTNAAQDMATAANGLAKFDRLVDSGGLFAADGKPLMDFSRLTTAQKAVVGDTLGASKFESLIPGAEKIGRSPGVGQTGVDDLYKVNKPGVDYVVVEYKYGTSTLKNTADGLQMSDTWLTGANTNYNRIFESVGGNRQTADAIRDSMTAGRIEKWLVHTDPYGNVTVGVLDKSGKLIPNPEAASKILGGVK